MARVRIRNFVLKLIYGVRFAGRCMPNRFPLLLFFGWALLGGGRGLASTVPGLRGSLGAHDPGTIVKCKDRYYLFYTGQGIPSKSSADKIFWTEGPPVFATAPAWTTNAVPGFSGTFWAPDIILLNNRYCLYYAVSTFGSQVSAIGLATNPTLDPADPSYHWTDQGIVIQSGNGSPYNTIDPSLCKDSAGNPWMSFGSYWSGIYTVQLDPVSGLAPSANPVTYHVAYNSAIEASCLFRHGGYYYLFVDWGSCCSGVNSTYNVRLGRATSPAGPFLDRNGVDMVNNGGSLFLQGTGKFTGPGHIGILSENGSQWFSYHYYDAGAYAPWYNAYGVADFDLEPLLWTPDDWPMFMNDWSAVYKFQTDALDENGQYYGLLLGGASIRSDSAHGRVLNLSGTNQYVQLPPGVGFARTFEAVVKWNGGGAWQRIFDFGTDTSRYVMLTPSSGDGKLRCDIRANGSTQTVQASAPLPVGVWCQVALTLDGSQGILYLNGSPAASAPITLSPVDVLAQTNHLGHSKFVADPDFNGQFASFRVFGRVLSSSEIAGPHPSIVQPVDSSTYLPGSTFSFSGSASDLMELALAPSSLSWRITYALDGRTNIVYGPAAGIANGVFQVPTNEVRGGVYSITLTATDNSGRQSSTSVSVLPANPRSNWQAYYPLRANANDANGHYNGTLYGGAGFVNDAQRGMVLNLSGSGQFVGFPAGVGGMQTFMAWVKWNGGGAWQRIFDFGNDTNHYTVLTPSAANGKYRFNISLKSIPGEQIIDGPASLPVGVWTHVAVTLDGNVGILYTNGVAVATNANVNLVPANLGATNNYVGKSEWPDPYFNGRLSSVRLFSRALSAEEIVAPQATISQPLQGSVYNPGDVVAFSGGASDFYDSPLAATNLIWTVQYINAGVTNSILGPLAGITNGAFNIPSNGVLATNGLYRVVLAATDAVGRQTVTASDIFPSPSNGMPGNWSSFYPFDTGANDASNRFNGTLINGASIVADTTRGEVLSLSAASQYALLPAGVGAFQTLGAWVKWNGGGAWQRVFDFGQNTTRFCMLTPSDGSGRMQCALTADSAHYVQVIQAPSALPVGVWTYVSVAFDGRQGILYTNGQVMAVNNSVNLLPSDSAGASCYLARSQYPADPYFNGRLDWLRIASTPLTPSDLIGPTARITVPLAGTTYAGGEMLTYAGQATDFWGATLPASAYSWSTEFHHDGQIDAVFGPLTGQVGGSWQVPTTSPLSTNVFYRLNLQVTDQTGLSRLTSVDLLPEIVTLQLDSVPSGLQLGVDNQTAITPLSLPLVAGIPRTLSAPSPQRFDGSNYSFVLWSDGGSSTQLFQLPLTNASLVAGFVQPSLSLGMNSTATTVTWPGWAGAMKLYTATNLIQPITWNLVTNPAVLSNGMQIISTPTASGAAFYQLRSP